MSTTNKANPQRAVAVDIATLLGTPEQWIAAHTRAKRDGGPLSEWLHHNVPPEIAKVVDDILDGKLKVRRRKRPLPSKRQIERQIAVAHEALKAGDRDYVGAAERLGYSLQKKHLLRTARELVARLHGLKNFRPLAEIRYPNRGEQSSDRANIYHRQSPTESSTLVNSRSDIYRTYLNKGMFDEKFLACRANSASRILG